MDSFIIQTSKLEQEKLDKQIARFFYGHNLPFNAANGQEFIKMIKMLRPGYTPPCRKRLADDLLDSVYSEVSGEIVSAMKDVNSVVLTQDGWSSVQNDPIIAHSFSDGKESYLLELVESGKSKKTAEYCTEILGDAIEKIKQEYDTKVFAICTDNEAKMRKVRRLITEKYPDMITYGCNAHYLNLLQEDVSNQQVMKHIVEVQKYFRNVHVAHGMLKERGGAMPQLPNETRWNSNIECLETFKNNHPIYVEIRTQMLQDGSSMPVNVGRCIDNIQLLREATYLLDHMKKFGVALDRLQAESCTLADGVNIWMELINDKVFFKYGILQ